MFAFAGKIHFSPQAVSETDQKNLISSLPGPSSPTKYQWKNGFFCNNNYTPLLAKPLLLNYQSCNSHLSISGDIQLYNKNELYGQLNIPKHQPDEEDCFLLIKAFEKWGTGCLHHLNGDFSFGIWDHKTASFFAARDQIGVKQFYYNYSHDQLTFANGIREVLKGGQVSQEINSEYIIDYLLAIYQDTPDTLFKKIQQLPSGCYLLADQKRHIVERYWKPTISGSSIFRKNNRPNTSLRNNLIKSLRERISASSPTGFLLSGGLDSSSLVCLTKKFMGLKKPNIHVFSKVPEQNTYKGEREFLDIVLKHTNLEATCCTEELAPDLPYLHEYYRENYTFPVNPFFQIATPIRQRMKSNEIYHIISGLGGDETASEFADNIYVYFLVKGHWKKLLKLFQNSALPTFALVKKRLIKPLLPKFLLKYYYKHQNPNQFDILKKSFINDEYLKPNKIRRRISTKAGGWNHSTNYDPRREILSTLTSGYMHGPLTLFNCLGRMYSNNIVFPFLDIRVIQCCLAAKPESFRTDDIPRSFLRDAMKDILPTKILNRRTKSDFSNTATTQLTTNPHFPINIIKRDNKLAWSIINRKDLQTAYIKILQGKYPKQLSEGMAFQVARCINVVAFLQWLEDEGKGVDREQARTT